MSRALRPCERRATRPMLRVLRGAARLARGAQGEPWCCGHGRILDGMVRRGLAEDYRVTPAGKVYRRATAAGLDLVGVR